MSITENILCTKTHEYILKNDDNTYTIGLTDFAVEQLGDIVFLELPEIGANYNKGDSFGAIESVKAASEIYMPISGEILEINSDLVDSPEKLNEDVYETGWLVRIKATGNDNEISDLVDYKTYKEEVE